MSGGIGVLEHIKNLLSFGPISAISRKRRLEDPEENIQEASSYSEHPLLRKYRRVSNYFPKTKTPFDDEMDYLNAVKRNRSMQQRALNGGFPAEPSFFTSSMPPRNYGDIEFSDDEDDVIPVNPRMNSSNYQNAQPSTSGMSRNYQPNVDFSTINGRRAHPKIPDLIKIPRGLAQPSHLTNGHHSTQNYSYAEPSTSGASGTHQRQSNPPKLIQIKPPEKRKTIFSKFKSNFGSRQQSTSESIIQQNINLVEKKYYQQLLEKLVPSFNKQGNQRSKANNNSVFGTKSDHNKDKQNELFKKPPTPIIDLSDDDEDDEVSFNFDRRSSFPGSRRSSLLSSTKFVEDKRVLSDGQIPKSSSLSPSAVKKSPSTDSNDSGKSTTITPVNSLSERLGTRPYFQADYATNINKHFIEKKLKTFEDITIAEKSLSKIKKETKERETKISEKFSELQIHQKVIVLDEEEEEEVIDEYPGLTQEHVKVITHALRGGPPTEVIISIFKEDVTRASLNTIVGDSWLNDQVINVYVNLISDRGSLGNKNGRPAAYCMNTFFTVRLLENGYSGVRRWTKKIDIFAYDIIPVPVHVGKVHWCMAIIHLKNKTIKYYDPMGHPNYQVLDALEQYLKAESMDKKNQQFDMTGWTKECVRDCPQQKNGSDCGVFSLMFAEFICRNSPISFHQQHMQYFRSKMIYEIATGKLMLQ